MQPSSDDDGDNDIANKVKKMEMWLVLCLDHF